MSDLPEGWAATTLGALGNYWNGRGFKKSEWKPAVQGRPIIRIQDLTGSNENPNYFDGEADERNVARSGDILVSWAATLGVFEWRGPEAVINQHIFKVESSVDPGFHRYLLESVLDDLRRRSHGTGMVHVTRRVFDETPVLLPPPVEQRRIVAAIEEHFSRLDNSRQLIASAARRVVALRASLFQQALAGPWPHVSVEEIAQIVSGQTPKGLTTMPEGEIPYYKVGDMNHAVGRVMGRAREYLDVASLSHFKLHVRPAGTVIFPKRGGAIATNKKRILRESAVFDLNTMGLIPGEAVEPRYLLYWLETVDLSTLADGSNVPQINHGDIAGLRVPLPPRATQCELATELERQLSILESLAAALDQALARTRHVRASILQAAFSGRLWSQSFSGEALSNSVAPTAAERATATLLSDRRRR